MVAMKNWKEKIEPWMSLGKNGQINVYNIRTTSCFYFKLVTYNMLLSLNDSTFLNVTVLFEIFLAIYIPCSRRLFG